MDQIRVQRLLSTVQLAQPLDAFHCDLFRWASTLGEGPVSTMQEFEAVRRALFARTGNPCIDKLMLDIYLAEGTINSLARRPGRGFPEYVRLWEQQCSSNRIKRLGLSDFGRLQALEIRLGGILLDDRTSPYVLILPQPAGHFVVMGATYVSRIDTNPFLHPESVLNPSQLHAPVDPDTVDAYLDPLTLTIRAHA